MDVLRFLFDLVIVAVYFATAFFLGSWLLALAPLAPSEYVLKINVTGPGGPSDVYTGIRVVP